MGTEEVIKGRNGTSIDRFDLEGRDKGGPSAQGVFGQDPEVEVHNP